MRPEEPPLRVLHDAAQRLSTRIRRSDPNLPEPEVLLQELEIVVRMVEDALAGGGPPGVPDESPSLLALRFLDRLRADVLESRPDDPAAGGPSDSDLLALVEAMEAVRSRLLPGDSELLGAPVLDPWARRLLGEVAHTLGSAMGPMVMLTEVLASGESGEVNDVQRHQLRILYRSALAAGSMALDLLRLAGPFEEPEEGTSGIFSVPDLVEEVGAVLAPLLSERGVEATIAPDRGVRDARPRVGRAFALRRALVSLSLASMTDEKGGTFALTASGDGDRVRFSVIRETETVEEEPPPAAGAQFRERSAGRGWHLSPPALGIASASHLVQSLGGRLEVERESPGRLRLSFSVALPPVSRS